MGTIRRRRILGFIGFFLSERVGTAERTCEIKLGNQINPGPRQRFSFHCLSRLTGKLIRATTFYARTESMSNKELSHLFGILVSCRQ